jgi:hypothetical protein
MKSTVNSSFNCSNNFLAHSGQTVEAASKSIPIFQEASAELRKVIKNHEVADTLETSNT